MIDQKTLELLREKMGGDFHLVSLFEKRLRELARGLPPLVNSNTDDLWQIVVEEILQNKLQLATGAEAERLRQEIEALPERPAAAAVAHRRQRTTAPAPESASEAHKDVAPTAE